MSNHLLNTPWPKVVKGKAGLEKIIRNENSKMESEMFQLLQFAEPFPDEQLPNTGVSLEMERMLSPLFIKSDNYGTRSSTILLKSGQDIQYIEK